MQPLNRTAVASTTFNRSHRMRNWPPRQKKSCSISKYFQRFGSVQVNVQITNSLPKCQRKISGSSQSHDSISLMWFVSRTIEHCFFGIHYLYSIFQVCQMRKNIVAVVRLTIKQKRCESDWMPVKKSTTKLKTANRDTEFWRNLFCSKRNRSHNERNAREKNVFVHECERVLWFFIFPSTVNSRNNRKLCCPLCSLAQAPALKAMKY